MDACKRLLYVSEENGAAHLVSMAKGLFLNRIDVFGEALNET